MPERQDRDREQGGRTAQERQPVEENARERAAVPGAGGAGEPHRNIKPGTARDLEESDDRGA